MSIKPFKGSTRAAAGDGAVVTAQPYRLPRSVEAPAQARHVVTSRLRGQVPPIVLSDTLLVVSELVTNAVMHGQGEVALETDIEDGRVRGRVVDEGRGFEHEPRDPGLGSCDGRGLLVVDALCESWGSVPDGPTQVWFVIAGAEARSATAPTSSTPLEVGTRT
jgi:Histidine kinase-like ATPase domain